MVSYSSYILNQWWRSSLNPCCNGRWSRTATASADTTVKDCLNPYCSGQWSRTLQATLQQSSPVSLNPYCSGQWSRTVVVPSQYGNSVRLNPYCSGQWSRTRPYKTILIISKLKNFTKQIFTSLNRKLTIS